MADRTRIEWADATWNPFVGCSRVSRECDRCYAKDVVARLARMGQPRFAGLTRTRPGRGLSRDLDWTGEVRLAPPATLDQPLQWRRPRRIFVCSLSDFFHPAADLADQAEILLRMQYASRHTFLLLTKRPDAARASAIRDRLRAFPAWRCARLVWPPNVWFGASVGVRDALDRARELRFIDAPGGRFLSLEPLLEPLDGLAFAAILREIDWVIVGGESGPGARPLRPEWVRAIRDQCAEAGVPFFFKQWGGANKKKAGRLLDGREWNARPREMP